MGSNVLDVAGPGGASHALQADGPPGLLDAFADVFVVFVLFVVLFALFAGLWRVFEKAGEPGVAALIPIYNLYVILRINGRSGWWLVGFLVPAFNVAVIALTAYELAKSFGKGIGHALGVVFLGFLFFPLIGYGNYEYEGPAAL